jgi:D-glycero-beta-D-manno-heptose-7-phosphate kinase
VLVVGDVMLDDYLWGDVKRICPEAPVPVVESCKRTSRPGGAGNAAANLAALGATARLCGVVGRDAAAENVRAALREAGVDAEGLLVADDRPTTAKMRVIAHNQQVLRIDTEQTHPLPPDLASAFLARAQRMLDDGDAVLICDYAKGTVSSEVARCLIATACQVGLPVVVDPKGGDYSRNRGASLIKPNLSELEHYFRSPLGDASDLRDAGNRLAAELDGTAVLLTQGVDGMRLFRRGEEPWHEPAALVRPVFDVTGAGDTVVSTVVLALACGASPVQAMRLANLAAGIVVGKLGTSVVSFGELRAALGSWHAASAWGK